MQIVPPDTRIDFVGQSRLCGLLSVTVFTVAVILMLVRGFNLGIDFAGGTVLQLQIPEEAGEVEEGRLRSAVAKLGYDATVVRFGAAVDRSFLVTVPTSKEETPDLELDIVNGLSEQLGDGYIRRPQRHAGVTADECMA